MKQSSQSWVCSFLATLMHLFRSECRETDLHRNMKYKWRMGWRRKPTVQLQHWKGEFKHNAERGALVSTFSCNVGCDRWCRGVLKQATYGPPPRDSHKFFLCPISLTPTFISLSPLYHCNLQWHYIQLPSPAPCSLHFAYLLLQLISFSESLSFQTEMRLSWLQSWNVPFTLNLELGMTLHLCSLGYKLEYSKAPRGQAINFS